VLLITKQGNKTAAIFEVLNPEKHSLSQRWLRSSGEMFVLLTSRAAAPSSWRITQSCNEVCHKRGEHHRRKRKQKGEESIALFETQGPDPRK
jgi:hypothetical protein